MAGTRCGCIDRVPGTTTWSEGTITGVVEDKCTLTSDKGPEVWQMLVTVGQLLGSRKRGEDETELCLRPKKAKRADTARSGAQRRSPRLWNQSQDRENQAPPQQTAASNLQKRERQPVRKAVPANHASTQAGRRATAGKASRLCAGGRAAHRVRAKRTFIDA